ncbi:ABC transporter substrate-binding protein [Saccharomonospora sp. NPDC046836]|uniref:ABC transporter substrate-binding protein n=1 Tax=Saccharomonospora sp. NPDC046836 TaxID=3156921 RepID=UPI0033FDB2A7
MPTYTLPRTPQSAEIYADISRRGALRLGAAAGLGMTIGLPALTGCSLGSTPASRPSSTPPARPTGVLRVANNAEPQTLDPTVATNIADVGILMHNVYEGLVQYRGDTNELEPLLAEHFESSPDAREWIFRLRQGVTFHDGEPLTSSAVKASFDYAKASRGAYGYFLPDGATYDDSDPTVLRITTPTPFPDMARNVSVQKIISPKLIRAGATSIKRSPAGTGPFRFVSYRTAQSVVLEANQNYWRTGSGPYLERLEFLIIPDPDGRISALRSGSVDLVLKVTPTNSLGLRGDQNIVVTQNNSWTTSKIFLYTKTPPMDNLKLREALSYAIDRQALIKSILRDVGGESNDSWVVPGLYGYHEPATTYPYDPDRARQLIAESGLPTPISINLAYSPDVGGPGEQLAQAISGMVKEVGIDLTVVSKAGGELGKVHTSPGGNPRPWHAMLGGRTFITGSAAHCIALQCLERENQLEDPRLADLGKQVLNTANGPERLQLFADVEQRVAELAPMVTLYTEVALHAHRNTVQGFVPPQDGLLPSYGSVYLAG